MILKGRPYADELAGAMEVSPGAGNFNNTFPSGGTVIALCSAVVPRSDFLGYNS